MVLGSAAGAEATVVRELTLAELVEMSALIVEGTVVSSEAVPADDPDHMGTTLYEVCELEVLAGEHGAECVEVHVPGDDRTQWSEMPALVEGERVILFLREEVEYVCPFVGWHQGIIRIVDIEGVSYLFRAAGDGHSLEPIAHVTHAGRVRTGRTRLTWRVDHPDETEVPFEILADAPWTRAAFLELLRGAVDEATTPPQGLPLGWHARTVRTMPVDPASLASQPPQPSPLTPALPPGSSTPVEATP